MSTYCCFLCPRRDDSASSLDDRCPSCNRRYSFPLRDAPSSIGDYRVIRPLGRGFYAATYVAERGQLGTKSVLKVSPKNFFSSFPDRDFAAESREHARVAQDTEHIVDIRDMFETDVDFGPTAIRCCVAELQYIPGELLQYHLEPTAPLSARTVAQISIDLFRIHEELQKKNVYHNDLHAENLIVQRLGLDSTRADAIDDTIRVVAIDLGSVSERSTSGGHKLRPGDLHRIGGHLNGLLDRLLSDPDDISDRDNRVARALQLIVQAISPKVQYQRTPKPSDFIGEIQEAYLRATHHWRPWREPLILKTFSASYNAQTMHAWHVPQLLVDPAEQWLNRISAPGPQVITGMRGCGKTMLLRALQFHARAAGRDNESNGDILQRLKRDNYVGLFVSAQRLLSRLGDSDTSSEPKPFERLFVTFGLEAARALSHLRDIDRESLSELAHRDLGEALAGCVDDLGDVRSASSLDDLDRRLEKHLISLNGAGHHYALRVEPHIAFCGLAKTLQDCSTVWQTARVLFLLDDVSTRYLDHSRIEELLSALLFQDASCAFKLTSERQTLALGLKSPGQNHPARIGRDLSVFDLGAEVYEKIKRPGKDNGRHFVERILSQRIRHFASHPHVAPSVLLGDVPLETLATEIAKSETTPKKSGEGKRKEIYRGITALARMCVGDIGDVISLYEQILRNTSGATYPVAPRIQSECFQDFCARRLYDLNRRSPFLMDIAKSFAEASHALLVDSYRGIPDGTGSARVRQYLSLYVRITTGDFRHQMDRLRELVDAGVFVFAGGSHVPRTKTRDSNPMQQFKLTYRKIYGLVNFIGLAERDRFELSGGDLEEWLNTPAKGKAILLRNHVRCGPEKTPKSEDYPEETVEGPGAGISPALEARMREPKQQLLVPSGPAVDQEDAEARIARFVESEAPRVLRLRNRFGAGVSMGHVVLGLGFEERTLESARRLCDKLGSFEAVAIEYPEKGKRGEILSVLGRSCREIVRYDYKRAIANGLPPLDGNVAIDITGLTKPVIFHSIRNELRRKGRVWVCYTEAEDYYPLDKDLDSILRSRRGGKDGILLDALSGILTGEEAPYETYGLLASDSDDTRHRTLIAFSSAKHERLLSLLDRRDYERMEIVAPSSRGLRDRVAVMAAEIAARNFLNTDVTRIGSRNLDRTLKFVIEKYKRWYVDGNSNFEFGLTGSKIQAVACAIASAVFKVSQCWYLQPRRFDSARFTQGVGKTHFYEVSLNSRPSRGPGGSGGVVGRVPAMGTGRGDGKGPIVIRGEKPGGFLRRAARG